jgi:deazaflavin-dependent oxidoreductase (nitroreductase family)
MTKVLNPVVSRFAGRRHFRMASQVHHLGRRSGRAYVTSAGARVVGDSVWIPLTFGTDSDWCRNIEAAGGGTIVYRGRTYIATDPEVRTRREALTKARAGFKLPERLSMRMLGIQHFLRMNARLDN